MKDFFKFLTAVFLVVPFVIFIADIIYSWLATAEIYIRSTGEAIAVLDKGYQKSDFAQWFRLTFSQETWDFIIDTPFVMNLFLLPIITGLLYLVFKEMEHRRLGTAMKNSGKKTMHGRGRMSKLKKKKRK